MSERIKVFRCNIDTVPYKSKDEAKRKTGEVVNRMKIGNRIMEVTPETLSEVVAKGFSFTAAASRGTAEKDFISIDHPFTRRSQIDADENIINFKNSVLHLDTMLLKPHSPSYLCTKHILCPQIYPT